MINLLPKTHLGEFQSFQEYLLRKEGCQKSSRVQWCHLYDKCTLAHFENQSTRQGAPHFQCTPSFFPEKLSGDRFLTGFQ